MKKFFLSTNVRNDIWYFFVSPILFTRITAPVRPSAAKVKLRRVFPLHSRTKLVGVRDSLQILGPIGTCRSGCNSLQNSTRYCHFLLLSVNVKVDAVPSENTNLGSMLSRLISRAPFISRVWFELSWYFFNSTGASQPRRENDNYHLNFLRKITYRSRFDAF